MASHSQPHMKKGATTHHHVLHILQQVYLLLGVDHDHTPDQDALQSQGVRHLWMQDLVAAMKNERAGVVGEDLRARD